MATAGKIKSQLRFSLCPGVSVVLRLQHVSESSGEMSQHMSPGSRPEFLTQEIFDGARDLHGCLVLS